MQGSVSVSNNECYERLRNSICAFVKLYRQLCIFATKFHCHFDLLITLLLRYECMYVTIPLISYAPNILAVLWLFKISLNVKWYEEKKHYSVMRVDIEENYLKCGCRNSCIKLFFNATIRRLWTDPFLTCSVSLRTAYREDMITCPGGMAIMHLLISLMT